MQTERLTLGQELRRRREAKGIELQDISNATRVAVRFLRAIEEDDFASLPGGALHPLLHPNLRPSCGDGRGGGDRPVL